MSEQNETFEIPSRGRPKKREMISECNYTQEPYFLKNNSKAQMCEFVANVGKLASNHNVVFDSGNDFDGRAYDSPSPFEHNSPYDPNTDYDQNDFFEKASTCSENSKFNAGPNLEGHDLDLYNGETYDDEQTKYITLNPNNIEGEKQGDSGNHLAIKTMFDMPNLKATNRLFDQQKFMSKQSINGKAQNDRYNTKNSELDNRANTTPSNTPINESLPTKSNCQETTEKVNEQYNPNIFKIKKGYNDINLQHKHAYNLPNNCKVAVDAVSYENNADNLNLPNRNYVGKITFNKQNDYTDILKQKNFPSTSYRNRDGYNPSFHKRNDSHNYTNNQMFDYNLYKRGMIRPDGYNITNNNGSMHKLASVTSSRNMTPRIDPPQNNGTCENTDLMQRLKAFSVQFTKNKPQYGQNNKFAQQMLAQNKMKNIQGLVPSNYTQNENLNIDNIAKNDMSESSMFQQNGLTDNKEKMDENELYNPKIFKQESIANNQTKLNKENIHNENIMNNECLEGEENETYKNNIEIDPSVFNQDNYSVSKGKKQEIAIKNAHVKEGEDDIMGNANNYAKMFNIFPKKVFENALNRDRAKYNNMPQIDPAHNNVDSNVFLNQQQNSLAQTMSAHDQQTLLRMDTNRRKHHSEDGALYNRDIGHKDAMIDYNNHPSSYPGNLPSSHFMNNNAWIHRKKRRNTQLMWQYAKELPKRPNFLNNQSHLVLDQDIPPSEKSSVNYIQGAKLYLCTYKKHAMQPEKTVVNHTILPLFLNNSSIYDNSMNAAEFNKIVSAFNDKIAKIDYENVTVQQLKTVMKEFGLNHTGKKIELIDRVKKTVQKIQDRQNFYKNNPNNYDNTSLLALNEENSGTQSKKSEPFKMMYKGHNSDNKRIEDKSRGIDLKQIAEYEAATGNDWLFF